MVSAFDDTPQAPLVLLSGGGGGARLAAALSKCIVQRPVVVATNTGDDFEHLGLLIQVQMKVQHHQIMFQPMS